MSFTHKNTVQSAGSALTATITHGLTIADGDLLVLYINRDDAEDIVPDAGGVAWTTALHETPTSETAKHMLLWKIAGASEPASYTFSLGSGNKYHIILKQFSYTGGTVQVDSAAVGVRNGTVDADMLCSAINGAVISDNALSIIFAGKDRDSATVNYDQADNGYVGVIGSTEGRYTAGAHKIYTTGETFSGSVTIDNSLGGTNADNTYSAHMSFITGSVVNSDPTLDSPEPDLTVSEGDIGSDDLSTNFSDADLDPLTFSVSPALPTGFSLNTTTGVLSWDGTQTEQTATAYTVTADDGQGGTPAQDTFNITVTAPSITIDSVTAGPHQVGDSVTVTVSNAPATGKGVALDAGAITEDSETPTTIVFTVPDPKTFGNQTSSYNTALTLTVDDGLGGTDTTTITIEPTTGDYYDTITSIGGIYLNDTGVEVGDNAYATWVSGSGLVFLDTGSISSTNGTLRYWLQDQGTGVWSSSADEIFTAPNNPATGSPVITGTATEGQTLGVNTSSISDADGLGSFSYQWKRDDVDIGGATSSTYLLTQADVGTVIKVNVSFTDGSGYSESLTSSGTSAIANVNQSPTGSVTIDNTAPTVGDTLTASNTLADIDGLGSITYQWRRSGENISGATGTTYVVTITDVSNTISVVASYTDQQGTQESVASSETSAVPLPPDTTAPVITLNGPSTVYVAQDSTYNDLGATAIDDRDGDITGNIVPTSTVNTASLGTYTVTYNVDDAAGNSATPVVRTVEVVEFSTVPEATNEQAIAFFRAETGLNTYNMNELAIAYYKQVTGSVLGSFNDLQKGAADAAGFQGYSPADYRNYI